MTQSAQIAGLSFSGADVKAYATIPYRFFKNAYNRDRGPQLPGLIRLKDLQTFSVSIYRDVSPVRALGHRNVRGHTRGGRTIAGSLIFALIDEHPLQRMLDTWVYEYSYDIGYWDGYNFPDQIPPFNIHLVYSAELPAAYTPESVRKSVPTPTYGTLTVFGLNLTNDGMVTSIEDLLTENTYQYVARDMHVYQGYANSRDPKGRETTTNRAGHVNIADEERINAILGAFSEIDPTLTDLEARALYTELESSRARQGLPLPDLGFSSKRELSQAALRRDYLRQAAVATPSTSFDE